MKYKLMTFNLRYPFDNNEKYSWKKRKENVIEFINKLKPEILGTQEVFNFMKEDILKDCPSYSCYGIPRASDGEGVPIFYNKELFEIVNSGNFWLSETPRIIGSKSWNSNCVRMCTWVEFALISDRSKKLRVYNTHLDHISEEARINGFNVIINEYTKLNEIENLPTFIIGDFNAEPSSITMTKITNLIKQNYLSLEHSYKKDKNFGVTFHDFKKIVKGEPIDYIYYSKDLVVNNLTIHHNDDVNKDLSDHYPVSIDFEL